MARISDEALTKLLNETERGKLPRERDLRVSVEVDDNKAEGGKRVESFLPHDWFYNQSQTGRMRPYPAGLIEALAKHGYKIEEYLDGWRIREVTSKGGADRDQASSSRSREKKSSPTPKAEKIPTGSPSQSGSADASLNAEYGYRVGVGAQGYAMTHAQESVPWEVPDFEEEARVGAQELAAEMSAAYPNWQELLYGATAQDYLPQVPQEGFIEMPVGFGDQAVPAVLPGPAYDFSYPVESGIQGGPAQPYGDFYQAATDMGYGQSSPPHNPVSGHAVLTQPPLGPAGQFGMHGTDQRTTDRGWTGGQWQMPSQGQVPSQGKAPTR
ncbi:hypothetical protein ACFC09_05100 [Streptomyces sp. NPDC056161]|uniref:hypothetical protein n=1 Tax=Streptomyces sp. NPDC056161 TaxID=3345732 RepID=UPI0035E0C582